MIHEILLTLSGVITGGVFKAVYQQQQQDDLPSGAVHSQDLSNSLKSSTASNPTSQADTTINNTTTSPTEQHGEPIAIGISPDFPFLHAAERESLLKIAHIGFQYSRISDMVDKIQAASLRRGLRLGMQQEEEDETSLRRRQQAMSELASQTLHRLPTPPPAVQQATNNSTPATTKEFGGSYTLALCREVNKFLEEYRMKVVEMEAKIMDPKDADTLNGKVPVSFFTLNLVRFARIFPALLEFLRLLVGTTSTATATAPVQQLHGVMVNDKLHRLALTTGNPDLRRFWLRCLQACNLVMMRQIADWVLFGDLRDAHEEFFVRANHLSNSEITSNEQTADGNKWVSEYSLDLTKVPSFLPIKTCQSILFIGKAVKSINDSLKPQERDASLDKYVMKNAPVLSKLLEQEELHMLEFEADVHRMRKEIASQLWKKAVVDSDLARHMQTCRDYFLLGRGDFYVTFLECCESALLTMSKSMMAVTPYDVYHVVQKAAELSGIEDDKAFQQFKFVLVEDPSQLSSSLYDNSVLLGRPIKVECTVKWPLDILFGSQDIEKYNQLFTFLITLRRVQMRLQKTWKVASLIGGTETKDKGSLLVSLKRLIWRLRSSMLYFIDSLWVYVQMDVIAVAHYKLTEQMINSSPSRKSAEAVPTAKASTEEGDEAPVKDDIGDEDDGEDGDAAENSSMIPPHVPGDLLKALKAAKESFEKPVRVPLITRILKKPVVDEQKEAVAVSAMTPPVLGDFEDLHAAHQVFLETCMRGCFLDPAMSRFMSGPMKGVFQACDRLCGLVTRIQMTFAMGISMPSDTLVESEVPAKLLEVFKIKKDFEQQATFLSRILTGAKETSRGTNSYTSSSSTSSSSQLLHASLSSSLDALLLRLDQFSRHSF